MSDWGADSDALFRRARRDLSPTGDDRARVRARIAARIGAGAVVATVATTTSKAAAGGTTTTVAAKTASFALVAKILAPVAVACAVTAVAVRHEVAPSAAKVAIVAPPPAKTAAPKIALHFAESAREAQAERAAETVRSAPTPTAPPAVVALPAAGPSESELVAAIDAALRANDPRRAQKLAAEHERRFPAGLLVDEREAARVIAACMGGSTSSAAEFLSAHPRSTMRTRILGACGSAQDEP